MLEVRWGLTISSKPLVIMLCTHMPASCSGPSPQQPKLANGHMQGMIHVDDHQPAGQSSRVGSVNSRNEPCRPGQEPGALRMAASSLQPVPARAPLWLPAPGQHSLSSCRCCLALSTHPFVKCTGTGTAIPCTRCTGSHNSVLGLDAGPPDQKLLCATRACVLGSQSPSSAQDALHRCRAVQPQSLLSCQAGCCCTGCLSFRHFRTQTEWDMPRVTTPKRKRPAQALRFSPDLLVSLDMEASAVHLIPAPQGGVPRCLPLCVHV